MHFCISASACDSVSKKIKPTFSLMWEMGGQLTNLSWVASDLLVLVRMSRVRGTPLSWQMGGRPAWQGRGALSPCPRWVCVCSAAVVAGVCTMPVAEGSPSFSWAAIVEVDLKGGQSVKDTRTHADERPWA